MTVTYSLHVSRARLCGFAKLLIRWRGSIYKLLYREMLIFCGLYYGVLSVYNGLLSETQRIIFEKMAIYCETFTDLIPLSFVLGFYVSIVVGRWWQQFTAIPWPDKTCMLVAAYVHGADDRSRMIRRTLARYLSLMSVLTFQAISPAVKKRFPTLDHVQEAGLMTKEERRVYEEIPVIHGKWWVPAQWFTSLTVRARKEGRIKDDILLRALLEEMHNFRGNCGLLFSYDWISIPLVYTQVVTLAIYTYFLATIMGRQYLDPSKGYPGHDINLYVPVFTILQFFFYMGWLKVAEQLINPFGEDDDDFELNWCLDRNLQLSFMIVDEMHQKHPRLVKDAYWDELEPQLPYTKLSVNLRSQPHLGSAINLDVNPEESEFLPMETIMEEDNDENNYNSAPTSPAHELAAPNFPQSDASRKSSVVANDGDSSSLSRFKLSDFSGSRFLNMIIGSSSENIDSGSVKENSLFPPIILRTPNRKNRRFSCTENIYSQKEDGKDDVNTDEAHLTNPQYTWKGEHPTSEESQSLIIEMPFEDKPPEFPTMKVHDILPTVEEERSDGSREGSAATTPEFPFKHSEILPIVSSPSQQDSSSPYEPNTSTESLLSSESNQSTINSYTELLQNQN